MILIIGGAYQGKFEYAKENFKEGHQIINNFHKYVRKTMQQGKDDYFPGIYGSQLQVNCLKADLPEVPVYGMRFYLDDKMYEVESVGDDMGILTIQLTANDR